MILLTGAAGKTGTTILKNLAQIGAKVRCLVRNQDQAERVMQLGSTEVVIGDLSDSQNLEQAVIGVHKIYYIAPNVSPDELTIGKNLISLAKKHKITRFVYHSVLHPHVEAMPHHWQKMRMEEALFTSGLDFTILQPCAYMQNILGNWKSILDGNYVVPYQLNARISVVDLEDVAMVAAKVLTEPDHSHAIYELAGPENLSQIEVARQLSHALGLTVKPVEQSRAEWESKVRTGGMRENQIKVLLQMFEYYDKFGFTGNSKVLEFLLGEEPVAFNQFLARISPLGEER